MRYADGCNDRDDRNASELLDKILLSVDVK